MAAISFSNTSLASPLAVGAIERVDLKNSSVVVLGQQFQIDAGTLLSSETSYPNRLVLSDLAPNTLVLVDGKQGPGGVTHVDALIALPDQNVPGASQLLVTGVVSEVSNTGQIRIGQLKIDVTPTLALGGSSPVVGDVVEVSGTQPQPQGVFLAQGFAHTDGVGGTGRIATMGVGGTGRITALGVGGTGKYTALGVGGTGKVSTAGVGGTGKITALGVGGTGKVTTAGVGGTGKYTALGVGGTGKVTTAGVGGTGKITALGVGGTGKVTAAGVGGTGKVTTAGVGGTG
jgi:hypothetical protein